MREPSELTLPELLEALAKRGCVVTRQQLHRWRKFGLLQTPELVAGGRNGRTAYYPAVTVPHLLTLTQLLTRSRNLDVARWQLFLRSFPVCPDKLKRQLAREVQVSIDRRDLLMASDTDDAADDAMADAVSRGTRRQAARPLGKLIKKRVRGEMFDFIMAALRAMLGLGSSTREQDILGRVVQSTGDQPSVSLPPDSADMLARLFDPERMVEALAATSHAALDSARREFLFDVLPLLQEVVKSSPEHAAAMALDRVEDPYWPDPLLFLLWLSFREHPLAKPTVAQYRAELFRPGESTT